MTFIGGRAYVASGEDGLLRVHSLDGRASPHHPIPVGSYNVQAGDGVVLTPSLDRGTLCVVGRGGEVLRTVQVAPSSHDACFVLSR